MKTVKVTDKTYKFLDEKRGNETFASFLESILFENKENYLTETEIEELIEQKIREVLR